MIDNFQGKLKEYARLLVRVGLNVQKGQRLVISAPVECAHALPCEVCRWVSTL